MDLGIKGRLALVTGASKGIGMASAMALARKAAACTWFRRIPSRWSAPGATWKPPAGRR